MRLLKCFSGLAALFALAISCHQVITPKPTVSFDSTMITIAEAGGIQEIAVKIKDASSVEVVAWSDNTYKTASDWLTAEFDFPKIKLTAESNTDGPQRSAMLRVTVSNDGGTAYATLRVVQDAGSDYNEDHGGGSGGEGGGGGQETEDPEFEFDTHALAFGAEGGSQEVSFSSNGMYLYIAFYEEDLETEATWMDYDDGSDDNSVTIVVSPNTGEERIGYFVVFATMEDWDENEDADYVYDMVQITQEGADIEIEEPDVPVSAGVWTKVTSQENLTSGWYLIACESKSVVLDGSLTSAKVVSQGNHKSASFSNGSVTVDAALAESAFWYSASSGSFLSGGDYYIGYLSTDGKNNGMEAGSSPYIHTVTITSDGADISNSKSKHLRYNASWGGFRFYQESTYKNQTAVQLYQMPLLPPVPAFSVSTTVLTAGPKATQASFSIIADNEVSWKAQSSNADFTLSASSGSGSAAITVSFDANPGTSVRSTTITVSTENADVETKSYTITLTQGPASEGDIDDGTPGYNDNLIPRRKTRIL